MQDLSPFRENGNKYSFPGILYLFVVECLKGLSFFYAYVFPFWTQYLIFDGFNEVLSFCVGDDSEFVVSLYRRTISDLGIK